MPDSVRKIAAAVTGASEDGARLRVAVVQEVVGAKVRLDITGSALVAVDADVTGMAVGERVYALQQGPVTVVSGRLTGTPPPPVPTGALTLFAGSSTALPSGYLLCDGASLLRTEWPDLFAVIGTTYGAVDANSFSLPNLVDRVPLGAGARAAGATGGAERVTLTTSEMPSHNHGSTGAHTHTAPQGGGDYEVQTLSGGAGVAGWLDQTTASAGGHTHASNGGGTSHENMQPWLAIYYIIRAT